MSEIQEAIRILIIREKLKSNNELLSFFDRRNDQYDRLKAEVERLRALKDSLEYEVGNQLKTTKKLSELINGLVFLDKYNSKGI